MSKFIKLLFGKDYRFNYKEYINSFTPIQTKENSNITITSSNIRTISVDDIKEKCWYYRAPLYKTIIEENNPDILGIQEATRIHMNYLKHILNDYDCIYMYRDKTYYSECCPIFYKKDLFTLINSSSFHLSTTPSKISKSWNAKCFRVCTYAVLKENKTNKEYLIVNTHLDHISELARYNGLKLILDKIKELNIDNVILMGDFNIPYNSDDKTIKLALSLLKDSFSNKEYEPTFNGYGNEEQRIDYILLSKNINVIDNDIITKKIDGNYPSDHYPITIKIK